MKKRVIKYLVILVLGMALAVFALLLYPRFCNHQFAWYDVPTQWLGVSDVKSNGPITNRQFIKYTFCPKPTFKEGDIVYVRKTGVTRILKKLQNGNFSVETTNGIQSEAAIFDITARD